MKKMKVYGNLLYYKTLPLCGPYKKTLPLAGRIRNELIRLRSVDLGIMPNKRKHKSLEESI